MAADPASSWGTLGVVGAGAMGRGIAQVAAQAGLQVLLHDAKPGAAEAACAELALPGLRPVAALADLAAADLVVEAIVESLDAKQALFRALEAVVGPDAVLATNTSSLSVTAIAAACERPQRVAGWHFFNPVPRMKVVEVVQGVRTAPAVVEALLALSRRLGHWPVRVHDSPGFLVNHAGRGYGTEALRLLAERVGTPAQIDAVLRGQAGFRLGPFELFDLTGLDVSVPVMEGLYRQWFDEPRYRPSPLAALRRTAGLLGRKSGEGWYRYEAGRAVRPPAGLPVSGDAPAAVWVSPAEPALAAAVRDCVAALGARLDAGERPGDDALCIVTPLGEDVTRCVRDQALPPGRTVGVDAVFDLARCRPVFASPATDPAWAARACHLFARDGADAPLLHDSVGLVAQRVVALIVNIACDIAQQGIAAPADIDRAVTLGLGYPHGPLAWGDRLGPARLVRLLASIEALTGDPRYRVSPWLRRRAELGLSLLGAAPIAVSLET